MSAKPTGDPGKLARAVSAEIRAELARQRISGMKLAEMMGRSQNYLAKRLRDEIPLSLNDVEDIGSALHLPAGSLVARASESIRGLR